MNEMLLTDTVTKLSRDVTVVAVERLYLPQNHIRGSRAITMLQRHQPGTYWNSTPFE